MGSAPDASTRRALSAEVAERGPLPLAEAVGYTLEACEAVAEAHAAGIAHGDLRPESVFLTRGPGGTTVEVPFVGRRSADASRQDVARDIAALGALLRTLISGMNDYELDGAKTLPSTVAEIVARALAAGSDAPFQNVSELAQELAPHAPPDHPSARRIALLMSRAGIVGSGMPLPAPQVDQATLGEEWFGPRSLRALLVREPSVRRRGLVFALVSLALVGFTLGGCLFLWRSQLLPRWTGTAPPEVGTTTVTSAPLPAVAVEEPASTPVEQLPDAPASAPAAPFTPAAVPVDTAPTPR